MKIKYDKKVDALYFTLAKGDYSSSTKVSNTILVDKDSKGNILGIEFLNWYKLFRYLAFSCSHYNTK